MKAAIQRKLAENLLRQRLYWARLRTMLRNRMEVKRGVKSKYLVRP